MKVTFDEVIQTKNAYNVPILLTHEYFHVT